MDNPRCSFCNRTKQEAKKLIAGPACYICDRCINACSKLIENHDTPVIGGINAPQPKGQSPREIYDKLGQYVISQERAKKVLAVAACNHQKRIAAPKDKAFAKANVLIMGPTGSGKTLLARTLAKVINVPFVVTDVTSLTASGYIGDDVETVLTKLYFAADEDIVKAQRGIIYLDEIDKIGRKENANHKDVGGEAVQQGLLKLLDGSTINVKVAQGKEVSFDTSNILFICGGAFPGVEEVRKAQKSLMGFGAKQGAKREENAIAEVTREELIKYGMIPEFIGRLPIMVTLDDLTQDDLIKILTEPKDAVLVQYQNSFKMDGSDLVITKDGAYAIAEKALKAKVGARGLRAMVEDILLDSMFDLPENPGTYVLNESSVKSGKPDFEPILEESPEAA